MQKKLLEDRVDDVAPVLPHSAAVASRSRQTRSHVKCAALYLAIQICELTADHTKQCMIAADICGVQKGWELNAKPFAQRAGPGLQIWSPVLRTEAQRGWRRQRHGHDATPCDCCPRVLLAGTCVAVCAAGRRS